MALTFGFYGDPALTTPAPAVIPFYQGVPAAASDAVVWFGSPVAGRRAREASDPGNAAIVIAVVDAGGGGSPASDVRLATSEAGLATAVPGAALSLGTQLLSGLGAALAIYVRVTDSTGAAGLHSDLSLVMSTVREDLAT